MEENQNQTENQTANFCQICGYDSEDVKPRKNGLTCCRNCYRNDARHQARAAHHARQQDKYTSLYGNYTPGQNGDLDGFLARRAARRAQEAKTQ